MRPELSPGARTEAQRVLDRAARRLLAERLLQSEADAVITVLNEANPETLTSPGLRKGDVTTHDDFS